MKTAGPPARPSPLSERLASFFCNLDQERYEVEKFRWIEEVSCEFPSHEPASQWNFTIESAPGSEIPYLRDGAPELEIRDWCKNSPASPVRKITRAFPSQGGKKGGISFHITKGTDQHNNGSYPDLRTLVEKWLPVGVKRFQIPAFTSLTVVYVNDISCTTAPAFFDRERGMEVGKILKMFATAPSGYEGITSPYACKMGFHVSREKGIKAEIQVDESLESRGIRVELRMLMQKLPEKFDIVSALIALDDCHQRIMHLFTSVFSEKAQQEFHLG